MTFDLHIHGETPAELLTALQQLNTSPLQPPQSESVPQPEKSKAQTPAKPKRGAQKPAAAPAEERVNPTSAPVQNAGAAVTTDAPAAGLPEKASEIPTTPAGATAPASEPATAVEKDPATEDKIRSLIMALMKQGKTKECKAIITSAGAASISAIKPESYTAVWEQLCKLNEEVNQNAAE